MSPALELARFARKTLHGVPAWRAVADFKAAGFTLLGAGAFKIVFRHPNWPALVAKVYRTSDDWTGDAPVHGKIPRELLPYFLPHLYVSKSVLVQEWADGRGGSPYHAHRALIRILPRGLDTHRENCAYHCARLVVLDFHLPQRSMWRMDKPCLNLIAV